MKLYKVKRSDTRYDSPFDVMKWLEKNRSKTWKTEKDFERDFERETDYEVLGVFHNGTNIIDPSGNGGTDDERFIPVLKTNGIVKISL